MENDNARKSLLEEFQVEEKPQNKCINFLLLGTSGNGKSASGNSITFQTSLSTSDSVKIIVRKSEHCSSKFGDLIINVVEVPGNQSDESSPESFQEFQDFIEEAFRQISDGFSAIVFVLKYGNRFTEQECRMMKWIKGVFGNDVVKNNLICLLTHGDVFEYDLEDDDQARAFLSWCEQQEGKIKPIFEECNYRCVLFNNKTKDQDKAIDQVKTLLDLSHKTRMYTVENYEKAEECRQQLENEIKAPMVHKVAEKKLHGYREELAKIGSTHESSLAEKLNALEELLNQVENLEKCKGLAERSKNMIKMFKTEILSKKKLFQLEAKSRRIDQDKELTQSKRSRTQKRKHRDSIDTDEFEIPLMQKCRDMEIEEKPQMKYVNLLLLGTSGNGKSASGNSITFQTSLPTSDSVKSKVRKTEHCSCKFGDLIINVVEVPGNQSDESSPEIFQEFQDFIEEAFRQISDGFSAIVFVLKYGNRFTEQECRMMKWIKGIFGDDVVKNNLICLLTHGDIFEYDLEDDDKARAFSSWCEQQEGKIKPIFEECNYRCVLFNNKTKDQDKAKDQVKTLLDLTRKLKMYTVKNYKNAKECREQLEDEIKAPMIHKMAEIKLHGYREELAKIESTQESSLPEKVNALEELLNQVEGLEKCKGLAERSKSMIQMFKMEIVSKKNLIQSEARSWSIDQDNELTQSKRLRAEKVKHNLNREESIDNKELEILLIQTSQDIEVVDQGNQNCVNLLLLGTERNGKSEVKNIIIGRKTSGSKLRFDEDIEIFSTQFESMTVNVFDFPEIDTDSFNEDLEMFKTFVIETLALCEDGFASLVLVLKYNGHKTSIDQHTLRLLRETFGRNVVRNNVVCVITSGDKFERDSSGQLSFNAWCRQQNGELKKLFQECHYRCTLFSDRFKGHVQWAEQVKPLLALSKQAQNFTKYHYRDAAKERAKFIQNRLAVSQQETIFLFKVLSDVLDSFTDEFDDQINTLNDLIEKVKEKKKDYTEDQFLHENDLEKKLVHVKRKLEYSYDRHDGNNGRRGADFERNTAVRDSTNSTRKLLTTTRNETKLDTYPQSMHQRCCPSCHIL